jgi:acyl dehydratase
MKVGDRIPELHRKIELQTLVRYAGASGDFNPIHYDEQYAKAAGLDTVIGHGMLGMALVSEAVTDWVGDSGLVKNISARFTGSYHLGDVLTVSGEIVDNAGGLTRLALRCVNQDGAEIIGNASATVKNSDRSDDD